MKNYSQNKVEQDVIIQYIINNNLKSGKLLDIGAFDGETFSNTRAIMENFPEWKGTLVEPSSYSFSKLLDLYDTDIDRVELLNIAITLDTELNTTPLLTFYESKNSPCISSSLSEWANNHSKGTPTKKIYVGKIGMKEVLETFGPFDFISIDVEGYSSALVMQNWFDPRNYGCKLICIESDGIDGVDGKLHIPLYEKLTNLGYVIVGRTWENLIMGLAK